MPKKKRSTAYRWVTAAIALVTTVSILLLMYIGVVWLDIPGISTLRDLWIETAMTTYDHQYLATALFPSWRVTEVMSRQDSPAPIEIEIPATDDPQAVPEITPTPNPDPLGQKNLVVGKNDPHGNKVVINDLEQGITMVEIHGKSFRAYLLGIDDPARVIVGTTNKKGTKGQLIKDMMQDYDCVAGINASGFEDQGGHGSGGTVLGMCCSQGVMWGSYTNDPNFTSLCFNNKNKLLAGNFTDWEKYNVRDGIQFVPVVIHNGERVVGGGYGLQPRSIVAQRADGVVYFLCVDGRSTSSLGATYIQCSEILLEYGVVEAAACDGGSSTVLSYKGKVMNVPSTPMKTTGRYLPNAFLVKRK